MPLRFTGLFFKSAACPPSQRLLIYRQHGLPGNQMKQVRSHLTNCDFCNAELQLLTRYQFGEEESRFAEMPAHLRRLAKRLLKSGVAQNPMPEHRLGAR